jgi:predicted homoserine dehydrogenase-like protein
MLPPTASGRLTQVSTPEMGPGCLNYATKCPLGVLWKRNIDSYKDLNTGKFRVITEMEKVLPVAAFTAEWEVLQRGENKSLYRPFHRVEILVPFIFAAVHLAQCLRLIPWNSIVSLVCR